MKVLDGSGLDTPHVLRVLCGLRGYPLFVQFPAHDLRPLYHCLQLRTGSLAANELRPVGFAETR